MTIWRWSLVQTILDGYPLKNHFIALYETHILDDEDARVVGAKKKKFIKRSTMMSTLKVLFL
jgi:hypothetical protein